MSSPRTGNDGPPFYLLCDIATAVADMKRLLFIDRAWTAAETRASEMTDRDRDALYAMGKELRLQVAAAEDQCGVLANFYESHSEWVNARIRQELANSPQLRPHRDEIIQVLASNTGDFAVKAAERARQFIEIAPSESANLREKVQVIRESGPIVTDMSEAGACLLAGAIFGAEVAMCPDTLGIGCLAAAATYVYLVEHC